MIKNIYLSSSANTALTDYLEKKDVTVVQVAPRGITYSAVDTHPDMYYCRMGVTRHSKVFIGDTREIGAAYPENIKFNAVCLDCYFIHALKHTSPALLREAREIGLACINVKQGYTKCNCVIVDGHSLITADNGIFNTLVKYPDINVLKIRPGFVKLEGFTYGFLGGASGRVGNEIIFNGDLSAHPDYQAIRQFVESRGLAVKYFPEYPLTDIGSIIADF